MKFRKNCFTVAAVLIVLFGIVWAITGHEAVQEDPAETEAEQVGRDIGEGIGLTVIFCVTAILFFFFGLMAWRNAVGIRSEERHREHMETMRGQQLPE